jgi:predicted metal-binding transcription factor (methanogenesis marker protein 9)
MPASLANEIWSELKRYINTVDRAEAAETMVSVLIDNDVAADEIRSAFKTDSDIKKALTSYLKDHEDDDTDDEDDDELHNDEDDEYEDY